MDLETKIAYQDKTIADLSDVVYAQEQRLAQLERCVRAISQQLVDLGIDVDPERFQRPPHY